MSNSKNLYQNLKSQSISGVKWSGSAEMATRIFQFVVTIILARILTPVDFGIITLALIIIFLMQLIIDFGLSSALIQRKEISEIHYSSTFSILIIFSVLSTGLVYFFSFSISEILGNIDANDIIKILSFSIIISVFSVIPRVILMRNLEFRKIAIAETVSKLVYGLVTTAFAVILKNIWCFIIGIYAEQLMLTLMLWLQSRWKPKISFSFEGMNDIFSFSSIVFGTRALNFANLNILNILINRFFGSAALGLYSLSYQVIDLPTQRIAKMIMKVMYPILSKLQDDLQQFQKMFLNYLFIVLFITLPIYLTLYLAAKPFILTFFGEKWIDTIPILKILCLLGLLRCLWTGISIAAMSLKKPKFELYMNFVLAIFLIPGFFIFSSKGLNFILIYFISILFINTLYGYYRITKWLDITIKKFITKFRIPAIAGFFAFMVLYIILHFFPDVYISHHFINLIIVTFLSVILYLIVVLALDKSILKMIFRTIITR